MKRSTSQGANQFSINTIKQGYYSAGIYSFNRLEGGDWLAQWASHRKVKAKVEVEGGAKRRAGLIVAQP
jgi:hypothetical protein